MRARTVFTLAVATLLSAVGAEQKTHKNLGKEIRKADLITLAYHQALKDFGDGIEDFHAEISYGDLSGHGQEDAAVTVHCRFGPMASANPSDVFVYAVKKDKVELVTHAGNGEKAHGGICLAYICCDACDLTCGSDIKGNGQHRLLVQRYRPNEKDCNACYGFVEETDYELRGANLIAVDTKTTAINKLESTDPCAFRTR